LEQILTIYKNLEENETKLNETLKTAAKVNSEGNETLQKLKDQNQILETKLPQIPAEEPSYE
jgi:uncharacterized protein YfcZ (UPF0381/DUF406 family)